jgi:hypothetical protein
VRVLYFLYKNREMPRPKDQNIISSSTTRIDDLKKMGFVCKICAKQVTEYYNIGVFECKFTAFSPFSGSLIWFVGDHRPTVSPPRNYDIPVALLQSLPNINPKVIKKFDLSNGTKMCTIARIFEMDHYRILLQK